MMDETQVVKVAHLEEVMDNTCNLIAELQKAQAKIQRLQEELEETRKYNTEKYRRIGNALDEAFLAIKLARDAKVAGVSYAYSLVQEVRGFFFSKWGV